ncbi:MAG: hypothetical protein A2516_03670 [Alphaproteobacteria bacterium RIFOXYD12_FULL_60_8]|nr:MAG: hypothetical protein A2516_03670 [Alphaproteobacteria bacterium RIFOXYD12_FULL_60_8]
MTEPVSTKTARSLLTTQIQVFFQEIGPYLLYSARRFQEGRTIRVAASLSYTTLLSIVPLMVICLAMLAAFPAFKGVRAELENFVFYNFVPQAGSMVKDTVTRFVNQAGKMTAVGLMFLAVTAIMLLSTIEEALNKIFQVKKARTLVSKLLVYWTVLTLGPMLIGASFSLSGFLFAFSLWMGEQGMSGTVSVFTKLVPNILAGLAFALLYLTVPNRRVGIGAALVGGLGAGILFAILRSSYGIYITRSGTFQTIYGALAALPIFLLWIYLSWTVVLFGAEMAAALPEWRRRKGSNYLSSTPSVKLHLAMEVLAALREESKSGKGLSREEMLERTAAPEGAVTPVLEQLREQDYIAQSEDGLWLLVRNLEVTRLSDLVQALGLSLSDRENPAVKGTWRETLQKHLTAAERAEIKALDAPLNQLLSPPLL